MPQALDCQRRLNSDPLTRLDRRGQIDSKIHRTRSAGRLAKVTNARVLTTVASPEKAERTRELGADVAINYREQDFVA
jgi:hypothetical protein